MWAASPEEYYAFFKITVETLRQVDDALLIAGPTMIPFGTDSQWIDRFVDFVNLHNLPLDCCTFHVYGEKDVFVIRGPRSQVIVQLGNKHHTAECIKFYKEKIAGLNKPVQEILVTEFNLTANHANYLMDTMFAACHVLYNYLENHDQINGIAHWTLSDIFEEDDYLAPPFGGGFGLLTREGIPKPAWYALLFLRKAQGEILEKGEEYCITKNGDTITILAFRYLFFDRLFIEGDHSLLTYTSRYEVFERKPPIVFDFELTNLYGMYEIREYTLDREHGSAFDLFVHLGMPQELSQEDVAYLRGVSRPEQITKTCSITGTFAVRITVPPLGIKMVQLRRLTVDS